MNGSTRALTQHQRGRTKSTHNIHTPAPRRSPPLIIILAHKTAPPCADNIVLVSERCWQPSKKTARRRRWRDFAQVIRARCFHFATAAAASSSAHCILTHKVSILGNGIVGAPAPFSWKPHNWHATGLAGSERGAAWRHRDGRKTTQRAATIAPKSSSQKVVRWFQPLPG